MRIDAAYFPSRLPLVKSSRKWPRRTPAAPFTRSNMDDSRTPIRRMRSTRPSPPPTQYAMRQSMCFATRFATTAPDTPTEATSIVP
ncbi:MAG: hypothetical protein QM704_06355 [Anaeromyxobacteraceae bacterium]